MFVGPFVIAGISLIGGAMALVEALLDPICKLGSGLYPSWFSTILPGECRLFFLGDICIWRAFLLRELAPCRNFVV